MSQSDYIKYKKINAKLSENAVKQSPVLNSSDYSDFKEFVIENTVLNKKLIYNKITDPSNQIVFNMEKKKSKVQNMGKNISNCPSFLLCNNTNYRKNRIPILSSYSVPVPQPINWKQSNKLEHIRDLSNCICNNNNNNN